MGQFWKTAAVQLLKVCMAVFYFMPYANIYAAESSSRLKPIVVQLKWKHQFQFAGFYAAVEKGFYRDKGFDVELKPAAPGIDPIKEVVGGNADYGVANSELMLYRMQGEPVTALAVIMQHSPLALLSLKESGILSPQDLIGKRVMFPSGVYGANTRGILLREGVNSDQIIQVPLSFNISDLVEKKVDAMVAYITDQPYLLKKKNIDYNVIDPRTYGIDFYGDTLFTREDRATFSFNEVKRFREATIQGWRYAINHSDEIVNLIYQKYDSEKNLSELRYEAEKTIELIVPKLVSIGSMNPGRWESIAQVFKDLNLAHGSYDEEAFVFEPDKRELNSRFQKALYISLVLFIIAVAGIGTLLFFNTRLKSAVRVKTKDLRDSNNVLVNKTLMLERTELELSRLNRDLENRVKERTHALETARKELENLAYYDSLTKLENRLLFRLQLDKAINRAARHRHAQIALLYVDIDNFKHINDSLGHDAGDAVLVSVANCLATKIRREDSAARISGDEFAILLSDIKTREDAANVAASILGELAKPVQCLKKECFITVSIGISLAPSHTLNTEELIKFADIAMYNAKNSGKNRFQLYDPKMNVESQRRSSMDLEITQALNSDQFFLLYQPKVSLEDYSLIGVEALIRWRHPEYGVRLPMDFIDIAEESGRIIDVGNWVVHEVAKNLGCFQGVFSNSVKFSINLSARQMRDKKLVSLFEELLSENEFGAENIELEITETSLIDNTEECIELLNRLKKMGFTISIDDFGKGYSSLSYLKQLPVDLIKIDQSFLLGAPDDQDNVEIICAVVAMAHKLRLKVVAEGVENENQVELLKQCNCDYAQGFYFGRPMTLEQLVEEFGPPNQS